MRHVTLTIKLLLLTAVLSLSAFGQLVFPSPASGSWLSINKGFWYQLALPINGGLAPYKCAITVLPATTPANLNLNVQSEVSNQFTSPGAAGVCAVFGTVNAAVGNYILSVTVTDANAATMTASGKVAVVLPPKLTIQGAEGKWWIHANTGSFYQNTFYAYGGTPPYKWALTGATVGGLTLDAITGKLSGTVQSISGVYSIPLQVTDSVGATYSFAAPVEVCGAVDAVGSTDTSCDGYGQ